MTQYTMKVYYSDGAMDEMVEMNTMDVVPTMKAMKEQDDVMAITVMMKRGYKKAITVYEWEVK